MNRYYIGHVTIAALGFLMGTVFATIIVPGDVLVLIGTGIVFGFSARAMFDQDFGGDWFWPFRRPFARKALATTPSIGQAILANKCDWLTITKLQSQREAMQQSNGPKFPVGSIVRVRWSMTDVDYPYMPFGGWVGRVIEVQEDVCTTCLIRWNQDTCAAMSLLFEHRCEGGGMDFTETWLDEDDLEHDDGKLRSVEHPAVTLLSGDDREERIRSVFGLSSGAPLPRAWLNALLTYDEQFSPTHN
jgi:hypothetical protein